VEAFAGVDLPMMKRHTPASIHPPFSNYALGMEVPSGSRLMFCSGQLGIAPDASIPESAGAQTEICFANIKAVLASAGMGLENIIRINAYVTDRTYLPDYMAVRNALFPIQSPASTLMIVSGFAREIFKVEIEVVAAGPERDPK
jgi:enamine deaminase RidA (YjgF/YER057c/UK114 family)